jgi:hypothetical protein
VIEVRRQPSTGQGDRRNRDRGPRGSLDRNGPDRNSNRGAYLWLRQLSCSGWPDVVFGCNGAKRLVWDRAAARTGSAKAAEDGSHIEEAGSAPTEEQRPAPLPEPSPPKCVTLLCTHVLVFHAFFLACSRSPIIINLSCIADRPIREHLGHNNQLLQCPNPRGSLQQGEKLWQTCSSNLLPLLRLCQHQQPHTACKKASPIKSLRPSQNW